MIKSTKHRVGYCCLNNSLGKRGGFRAMTVKKALTMSVDDRNKEIQQRTRENFSNLYYIMKYNAENNIHMYRVSSSMAVLHTHECCDYDFRLDTTVITLCQQIKQIAQDNDILLTIHCDQFHVCSTDREEVFQNTLIGLQYHVDLMNMLDISYNCIHVGSKKGGIEASQDRFITNFLRLPIEIQQSLMLENDDKSHNLDSVLEICELLEIPCCLDFHHAKVKPSNNDVSTYLERVTATWGANTPISHLSSSRDADNLISSHAEYVTQDDYDYFMQLTNGTYNVELECKGKNLSLLQLNL